MPALGGTDQHRQRLAWIVQQQSLAFHGSNRNGEAQPGSESAAPGARCHHHRAAGYVARGGPHAGDGGAAGYEAGDLAVQDAGASQFGAASQGQVEPVAVQLSGLVLVHRADDGVGEARLDGADILAVDPAHADVGFLPGHQIADGLDLLVVQGQPERRATLVEQVHVRGGFQLGDELRKLGVGGPGHLEGRAGGELGAQQAEGTGGVSRGAAADGVPLQHRHADALSRQVVGDGAADHAGANYDHVGSFSQDRAPRVQMLGLWP